MLGLASVPRQGIEREREGEGDTESVRERVRGSHLFGPGRNFIYARHECVLHLECYEVVHFLARVRGISVWNSCILDMPQTLSSNGNGPHSRQAGRQAARRSRSTVYIAQE